MPTLTRQQLALLIPLTLVWGVNWPVMKLGITGFPPLTFRALSIWLGVPVLATVLLAMRVPFRIARKDWFELVLLAITNLFFWNLCIILALRELSGGRTAILGYTMPVFSALLGAFLGDRLARRSWIGVATAGVGVGLLLWHELSSLAGKPGYVALALCGAATWALGTRMMRRTRIDVPTLALSFWITLLGAVGVSVVALMAESGQWRPPGPATWGAIAYNAVLIFGFSQAIWLYLARTLPPVASTISVMMIPVLGVVTSVLWLGEAVHWQDWVAVVLLLGAIAAVLWPTRARADAS